MEQEVARRLIPEILEQLVAYHMRRGLRKGCDCIYCSHKLDAYSEISHAGWVYVRRHRAAIDNWWNVAGGIWHYRRTLRLKWRATLRQLKSDELQ